MAAAARSINPGKTGHRAVQEFVGPAHFGAVDIIFNRAPNQALAELSRISGKGYGVEHIPAREFRSKAGAMAVFGLDYINMGDPYSVTLLHDGKKYFSGNWGDLVEKYGRTQNPVGSKYDRCLSSVRASGTQANEYAVCAPLRGSNPNESAYEFATYERHYSEYSPAQEKATKLRDRDGWRGVEIRKIKEHWVITGYRPRNRHNNPEPAAADLSESFHGRPPEEVINVIENVHYHENLMAIGPLVEIQLETESGYGLDLVFKKPRPTLSWSEDGSTPYIAGGDQAIDLKALRMDGKEWRKDLMILGRVKSLVYFTRKEQDNWQGSEYNHKSREGLTPDGTRHKVVSVVDPILLYDTKSDPPLLSFAGGQMNLYDPPVGIVG